MNIVIDITETMKSYDPKDKYKVISRYDEKFTSLHQALKWLKDKYENCSRSKMYYDQNEHYSYHTGYIYGYRNADYSHSPIVKWLQQDWVSIYELKPINLEKERTKV